MVVAHPRMTSDTSPAMYETEPLGHRCEHVGCRILMAAARPLRRALAPIGCLIAPEQRQLPHTVLKEAESQSREAAGHLLRRRPARRDLETSRLVHSRTDAWGRRLS